MRRLHLVIGLVIAALAASSARADKAEPLSALARMPLKEVTIFKDGHAFVLHSGSMPTDAAGNVIMDYLPVPVLGTFWPYSAGREAKLSAVTVSQRKVLVNRTALSIREFVEANVGAEVVVTEKPLGEGRDAAPINYSATIVGVPVQSGEELEATSPPYSGDKLPVKGSVVLLKSNLGMKVVSFDRIIDITFKANPKPALAHEEFRNLMTLKLEWPNNKPQKEAEIGLMYVQRGIRWIPNYKVTIDGKGSATVKLQGTLINELADLPDVTAHLVVGVPTFTFKDTVDPMSLQQAAAQLSNYFREEPRTAYAFSNAIMSQTARMSEMRGVRQAATEGPTIDLGPEVAGSGKSEDLFVFSVKHVTLKKGQRMTLPIAEYTIPYRDVYALDIPVTPPPEIRRNLDSNRTAEIARLMAVPKVMHKLRLTNKGEYPLTTAPAMIVRDNRVLAQGMMTYTAVGAETDLDLTAAVDVRVKKTDTETKREPNAVRWQDTTYGRIDMAGKINLTHFGKQPIEVEVVRNVLGNVTEADNGGKKEMVNVFEDTGWTSGGPAPYWWGWYNWPYWWHHFNGVGRITWNVKLEPGKPVDLGYAWNYYWR